MATLAVERRQRVVRRHQVEVNGRLGPGDVIPGRVEAEPDRPLLKGQERDLVHGPVRVPHLLHVPFLDPLRIVEVALNLREQVLDQRREFHPIRHLTTPVFNDLRFNTPSSPRPRLPVKLKWASSLDCLTLP